MKKTYIKDVEDILQFYEDLKSKVMYNKRRAFKIFAIKGVSCYICGVEGTYFKTAKVCGDNSIHLFTDNDVLINLDHVWPKTLGGNKGFRNRMPCCENCNTSKGGLTQEEIKNGMNPGLNVVYQDVIKCNIIQLISKL